MKQWRGVAVTNARKLLADRTTWPTNCARCGRPLRRSDPWVCGHIIGRDGLGGSVAFLLTRPGRNPIDDADRSWASGLTSAAQQHNASMWPVHFANDAELRVFAPDDLLASP